MGFKAFLWISTFWKKSLSFQLSDVSQLIYCPEKNYHISLSVFYPSLLGWQFCKIWWCDRHFSSCLNKNQEDLAWWNCDLIRYKILDVLNFFIKIIWEMFFFFIVLKKKYPFQIDNLLRVWLFEIIFSPYSLLMQKNIVALELLRQ